MRTMQDARDPGELADRIADCHDCDVVISIFGRTVVAARDQHSGVDGLAAPRRALESMRRAGIPVRGWTVA
jgi:hypothetical protein